MQSYKNDPQLKVLLLEETRAHREADQIVQGSYGDFIDGKWRGCAVGCAIHSLNERLGTDYETSDHSALEEAVGWPEWLSRLNDTIFEHLPKEQAMLWPEQFAEAIPVGVSDQAFERVKWQFCAFLLKENIERVLSLDIANELKKQVVDAIRQVLLVHESALEAGSWDGSAARAARSAAESARSAARSARSAWSAARSAARSAWSAAESARSAAGSAWSAAWSAWSAAESARSAAGSAAAYEKYAQELLRLLRAAE